MDGETKQDSERKAFYRAAPKIKQQWPCMEFLLQGDGLYANANVMELCDTLRWKYCLSLRDNLPTLKAEAEKRLERAKVLKHRMEENIEQELRYVGRQNYYLIAQIVHLIIQMATRTDAIHKLPKWSASKKRGSPLPLLEIFGSMRNFIKKLAESFRFFKPSWRNISELGNFQLRLLNSA